MIGAKGSLARQIITRTAALVALLAVVFSVATTLTANHILLEQVDKQLDAAIVLQAKGPNDRGRGQPPGLAVPGLPAGTIVLVKLADGTTNYGRIGGGAFQSLPEDVVHQLLSVPTGPRMLTLKLGGLGDYRVRAYDRDGALVVVGISLSELIETRQSLLIAELLIGLAAVAAAIVVSGAVASRATRPLTRLADTAREVSQLELHQGEVDLPVRVDISGLHPNHEAAQVGQAFNHMLNNVEGALASRQASETKVRQFVADASHELRNPLAAIRGYAELTKRHSTNLPEDTQHALTRIDAESARMSKLVNDLLLLARLDNQPDLALNPVDVTEVVLNAVSDARAASPTHAWKLAVPDDPMMVAGEADRLHQVVTNLLSNARTHTPPGTTVLTSVERDGNDVVVRVVDDGPGIAPELQQQVFERFARGDSMRTHSAAESTGLGLAIVSAVVGAHGGRVWLTSRPGRTEFSVALPVLASSAA